MYAEDVHARSYRMRLVLWLVVVGGAIAATARSLIALGLGDVVVPIVVVPVIAALAAALGWVVVDWRRSRIERSGCRRDDEFAVAVSRRAVDSVFHTSGVTGNDSAR